MPLHFYDDIDVFFFYLPFDGACYVEVVDVQVAMEPEVGLGKLETEFEVLLTRLKKIMSKNLYLVYVALYCVVVG